MRLEFAGAKLPSGWALTTIESVIPHDGVFSDGDWVESKDQDPNGDVRLIQLADVGENVFHSRSARFLTSEKAKELRCTYLKKGDILIARMPDPLGRACIFPFDGDRRFVTVVDVCIVRTDQEQVDRTYLCHVINFLGVRKQIEELQTGTTRKRISRRNLAKVRIPLPLINEQRRITAKIGALFSELDSGIAILVEARAQLGTYRQAVLKNAFEGKLTAQWREENRFSLDTREQIVSRIEYEREARFRKQLEEWKVLIKQWQDGDEIGKRPIRPRKPKAVDTLAEAERSKVKGLPFGWIWLSAESLGTVQLGRQRSPRNRSKDYPTKYLRAANITEHGLDLTDVLDMDFAPHEFATYRLKKGDLLLSEASGSVAQVGKPAIWKEQLQNCCFQNTVIRHRSHCADFSDYLLWLYRYYYIIGRFAQVAGGVGINHLSASRFAQVMLPICSALEQKTVVSQLEEIFTEIEGREHDIEVALEQAEVLRRSILSKAFVGELVPQDMNDETASDLIKRIGAEHECHTKRKMHRKAVAQEQSKAPS